VVGRGAAERLLRAYGPERVISTLNDRITKMRA
jgi:hypothetical protein